MQPPASVLPMSDMEAEIKRLREQVAELEGNSATQERPRVRQRISGVTGGGFPSDARFDPGGALSVDRRSAVRSAGSPCQWGHGTSVRIDVEDGGRGRTVEGDHMHPLKSIVQPVAHQCGLLGCRWARRPTVGQCRFAGAKLRTTQLDGDPELVLTGRRSLLSRGSSEDDGLSNAPEGLPSGEWSCTDQVVFRPRLPQSLHLLRVWWMRWRGI